MRSQHSAFTDFCIDLAPADGSAEAATPQLAISAGLTVAAGDTAAITSSHLRLSGCDPVLLDVILLTPPRHGALVRDGFALLGGDVFTQEDIDENRLQYRHDGGEHERDSFTFATSLGGATPTVFAIAIKPVPPRPRDYKNTEVASINSMNPGTKEAAGAMNPIAGASASAAKSVESPSFEPGPACPWTGAPTVAELLGEGIAVVRIAGQGRWQYSIDDGRTWHDFGPVYHGRARLLRGSDRVRFRPGKGASGKVVLSGRVWDEQSGKAGETMSLARRSSHGDATPFSQRVRTRIWELGDE
jgi:hypothetical protein